MKKSLLGAFALLTTVITITGCAVGPDFSSPEPPSVNGYTAEPLVNETASADVNGGEAQHFVKSFNIPDQWWSLFKSPQLNALIEQSLKGNPNLQAAEAALRVAQENVKAQQGFYYPSLSGNASDSRQQIAQSVSGTSPLSSGSLLFSLYTAQVAVSYTPDIFGLNSRTVEALQAQSESQRFQLAAAYLTLTSNVVAAAVQEASLRAQIAATEETIDTNTKMLDILHQQLAHGYIMSADVAAQEAQLAQAKSALPPLQKQLALNRDLLTALAGKFPSEEVPQKFELADLHLPQELPLSLPSQLVAQRPDVRFAEEQLHSASAQVGVAIANRLPQFTLSANIGDTSNVLRHLFNPADGFWGLAGNLTQPIFDGGTLLHRERGAEAAYDQAAAQYRGTVISAFQNVADTLRALQYDAESLKTALEAERATKVSLDVSEKQLKLGYTNDLAFLVAEQAYLQAKVNRVQAQANRYADTAALFQALGGGWWNAPTPAGPETSGNETQSSALNTQSEPTKNTQD